MRSCTKRLYLAAFGLFCAAQLLRAPATADGSPSRPQAATATPRPDSRVTHAQAEAGRHQTLRLRSGRAVNAQRRGDAGQTDDPDALYRDRDTLANVTRAIEVWESRLAVRPQDFEAAWKLARARYWLGTNGLPEGERKAALEKGMADARRASSLAPNAPEGHFWSAANMGALAESYGLRQGLKYRGDIRTALETTLKLDPAYLQGAADRALGRWYYKVPGLFGGSKQKSEAHLRRALGYNPQSIITRLFLAETLIELNRKDEARTELETAIAAPVDPEWAPEDRRFREQARALLKKLAP